jgi:hypothetical protein
VSEMRTTGPVPVPPEVTAAREFCAAWREIFTQMLAGSYRCTMTCEEAEAAAALWRIMGDGEAADEIIGSHARWDEPGAMHHGDPRGDLPEELAVTDGECARMPGAVEVVVLDPRDPANAAACAALIASGPACRPAAPEKTPGQLRYERSCEEGWRQHHRTWNRWETLTPEEKGEWERAEMLWGTFGRKSSGEETAGA